MDRGAELAARQAALQTIFMQPVGIILLLTHRLEKIAAIERMLHRHKKGYRNT